MTELTKIAFVSSMLMGGAAIAEEMPKPPAQVTERAKALAGTWKCDGVMPGMDGKEMKLSGTYTSKLDLDGFWIHDSFSGSMLAGKVTAKFKFEDYATFDPALAKWRDVFVDNFGGQMIGQADAIKDGKVETVFETQDLMGKGSMKDHLDLSDPKKSVRMSGEGSHDGGKTWAKVYDMTCKK